MNDTFTVANEGALEQLSATALMGTARAHPQSPTHPSGDNTPIIEEKLLKQVANVSLQHQVATLAPKIKNPELGHTGHTQDSTDLPYCSPQAVRRLRLMLEGKHTELLAEYLKLIQANKQRIPEIYAPNLLYRAHRQSALRPLIIPTFGSIAVKLAKSNPQWAFASLELDNWSNSEKNGSQPHGPNSKWNSAHWNSLKDYWNSERSTNRRHLLSQLRSKAPDVALNLLESTWSKETPSSKTWYLRSMLENLSMADEPFLETALDDRQHTVRKKAAETLTHLPESRLCQRMTKSAGDIIRKGGNSAESGLELHYPTVNTAMIRDGIPQRWDKDTEKAKLSQMTEMISSIPLTHWEVKLELTPAEIVEHTRHSGDYTDALIRGFSVASFRQANQTWAKALLEGMPPSLHTTKLVNYLSPEDFLKVLDKWEDKELLLDKSNPKLKLLQRWNQKWSVALTQSVLEHIKPVPDLIDQSKPPPALVRQILKATSTLAPVSNSELLNEINHCLNNFKQLSPAWKNLCTTVEETLNFRQEMYQEIKQ